MDKWSTKQPQCDSRTQNEFPLNRKQAPDRIWLMWSYCVQDSIRTPDRCYMGGGISEDVRVQGQSYFALLQIMRFPPDVMTAGEHLHLI